MAAVASDPGTGRGQFHDLTVARVDALCDDAAAITLSVPAGLKDTFRFRPGQSLTVRRMLDGRDERRSYSICAAAGQPLRIGVREVAGGAVSGWLVHDLRPGDVIQAQPPTGSFTPDLETPARHVLLSAGSGITPVLSIAASLCVDPRADVTILYGNRRTDSVMFADEVADLKDANPQGVQLVHLLSREPQEVELFNGRMDAEKLRQLLPVVCTVSEVDHWWLCGPFGMVTDAIEVLTEFGVPPARIHRELFYVEDIPPPQEHHPEAAIIEGSNVTAILDGRATTTIVARNTPLLDGMQRVRPDLPFSCKSGVCGTCRAKLLVGEVAMRRNFALEPEELDAGFVLTCQSLAQTDEVTVDFDS